MKQGDAFEEGIHAGIIYALIVLLYDGQESIAEEILRGCDNKAIRRIAKQEGDMQVVKLVDGVRKERRESNKYREKLAQRRALQQPTTAPAPIAARGRNAKSFKNECEFPVLT